MKEELLRFSHCTFLQYKDEVITEGELFSLKYALYTKPSRNEFSIFEISIVRLVGPNKLINKIQLIHIMRQTFLNKKSTKNCE